MPDTANAAQIDYWNATTGQVWVQLQAQLDQQLAPLGREAMRALAPKAGERILDIGCGCGQTTLELAAHAGPSGAVTGVDVSRPMLDVARSRTLPPESAQAVFLEADAQSTEFGEGMFDAAFSRFGVMFFSDPVEAFGNIRKSLKPGGRLGFVCWGPFQDNPWMRAPLEAAAAFLPPSPPADPTAPGPFAFADARRLRGILTDAGFRDISIDPFDSLIGGGDIEESLNLALRIGPLGTALRENPQFRTEAEVAIRPVLLQYLTPQGVLMPASVWIVLARAEMK